MDIAGGLYRELCDVPRWNALFGSGGRAAATLSSRSNRTTLHTYCRDPTSPDVRALERLGVVVDAHQTACEVAFAYFHSLSTPHMEPQRRKILPAPPIRVSGEVVLRFGFVEGDAVVEAETAIYDPQTHHEPKAFASNGSKARRLAVVLNEAEVKAMGQSHDVASAVARMMKEQNAEVVVVKRGVRGAIVFKRGAKPCPVPAYWSDRVFKIGTGDVFTATFAYYWGEARASARDAADHASRAVAAYCNSRELFPSKTPVASFVPVGMERPGAILLLGNPASLGPRWLMEEARFRLKELGVVVFAPELEVTPPSGGAAAALVLADGMDDLPNGWNQPSTLPVVIFCEHRAPDWLKRLPPKLAPITPDFASAIYFAAWAAVSHQYQTCRLSSLGSITAST